MMWMQMKKSRMFIIWEKFSSLCKDGEILRQELLDVGFFAKFNGFKILVNLIQNLRLLLVKDVLLGEVGLLLGRQSS